MSDAPYSCRRVFLHSNEMPAMTRDLRPSRVPSYVSDVFGPEQPNVPRFLSEADCRAMMTTVQHAMQHGGATRLSLVSDWTGEVRWARNRAQVTADRRNTAVTLERAYALMSRVFTNQTDPQTIEAAVKRAEALTPVGTGITLPFSRDDFTEFPLPHVQVWSDATFNQSLATRGTASSTLTEAADKAGMFSAGYLSVAARGTAAVDSHAPERLTYVPQTFAQCSLTVRDPQGTGSGWAGMSSYEWSALDPAALGAVALDKCLRSRNPAVIEPGRYTVILEPQAVHTFVRFLLESMDRVRLGESQVGSPFFSHRGRVTVGPTSRLLGFSKIGERLLDHRLTIRQDPSDPALGSLPFYGFDPLGIDPYRAVTWVDRGILHALPYNRSYGREWMHEDCGLTYSGAFRVSGGETSMDEMIATTARGLIVTRFSTVRLIDTGSVLLTGITRDGLWLVERGKITKPVKNFRFTESPFFALNQIEQLGVPVPVFSPELPAIVPPLKVRDFSFTSLVDAV